MARGAAAAVASALRIASRAPRAAALAAVLAVGERRVRAFSHAQCRPHAAPGAPDGDVWPASASASASEQGTESADDAGDGARQGRAGRDARAGAAESAATLLRFCLLALQQAMGGGDGAGEGAGAGAVAGGGAWWGAEVSLQRRAVGLLADLCTNAAVARTQVRGVDCMCGVDECVSAYKLDCAPHPFSSLRAPPPPLHLTLTLTSHPPPPPSPSPPPPPSLPPHPLTLTPLHAGSRACRSPASPPFRVAGPSSRARGIASGGVGA